MAVNDSSSKLTLFRGFPISNYFTWSPFVTKLEFRFRQADCPYKIGHGDPRQAPSGKIPYIHLTNSGETIGDSEIILKLLIDNGDIPDLNSDLTAEEKAMDISLRALCEDKLYFLGMHERWLDNFYVHRDHIFQSKPWLLRVLIGNMVHRKIVQTMNLQGCGRFTHQQRQNFREEIWLALENLAAQRRRDSKNEAPFWLLGRSEPTEADAVVFSFVNSTLVCTSCPDSTTFLKTRCQTLIEYERRIRLCHFPDYETAGSSDSHIS